jgi:hypothetical protein
MPAVIFPDVPEFQPFISALSKQAGIRHKTAAGYVAFEADAPIEIDRSATKLEEAVWFGALVAGFEGQIVTFDSKTLKII